VCVCERTLSFCIESVITDFTMWLGGALLSCGGGLHFDFICSQWERKGMHTDIHFSGWCNVGPEADVLHSDVRISW